MPIESPPGRARLRARIVKGSPLAASAAAVLAAAPAAGAHAFAHFPFGQPRHAPHRGFPDHGFGHENRLIPDSVVVSGTVYPRHGVNISVGQSLPFETTPGDPGTEVQAVADGQYPYVFNNDGPDGSFAVSTPIKLWDLSFSGQRLGAIHVPTDQMTTSFSSKSELAINVSTGGQDLSFSGYNAPVGTADASNSSTPGTPDPTNPDVAGPFYRVAGDLASDGRWTFTDTNSYSGDNGRAVLLD